jgi:hypothetical protein
MKLRNLSTFKGDHYNKHVIEDIVFIRICQKNDKILNKVLLE